MPKYFELDEFVHSDKAIARKIENIPTFQIVKNLEEFAGILDGIREAFKRPIYINSGYRCEELNKAVGGAAESGHKYGFCADLRADVNIRQFGDFIKDYLDKNMIRYDELLYEKAGGAEWIHFAWKGKDGRQRMKNFSIIK